MGAQRGLAASRSANVFRDMSVVRTLVPAVAAAERGLDFALRLPRIGNVVAEIAGRNVGQVTHQVSAAQHTAERYRVGLVAQAYKSQ